VILGAEYVAIMTTDAERAREFYTGALGFEEVSRCESPEVGTMINLELNGTRVALFGGGAPRRSSTANDRMMSFVHLALAVDDVDVEYARLKRLGLTSDMEPSTLKLSGNRLAFFQDPDGNSRELLTRPE
jgi:catechol 2,3-dioxygenase-like lactoylglutathione lyase family enzyme